MRLCYILSLPSYTKQQMELEIQRVAREMYKAFSGMNEEFEDVRSESCLI